MNPFEIIKQVADIDGSRVVLKESQRKLTYNQLLEAIEKRSTKLKFKDNLTALLHSTNSIDSIINFLTLIKCGFTVGLSDKQSPLSHIEYWDIILDAEGKVIKNEKVYKNKKLKNFSKERQGLILFTSGTGFLPKSCMFDLDIFTSQYPVHLKNDLSTLLLYDYDHLAGLDVLMNALSRGIKIILPENKNAGLVNDLITKEQPAYLAISPTYLNLLIMDASFQTHNFESVKKIFLGAEKVDEQSLNLFHTKLPDVDFIEKFGTTETGVYTLSNDNDFYKIGNEKHLFVKSKNGFLGYLESIEGFENGYVATGDFAETVEGKLHIMGRVDHLINIGGEKINPMEVEQVIMKLNDVDFVKVFLVPAPFVGWVLGAEVVSSAKNHRQLKSAIRKITTEKLGPKKSPVKIIFAEKPTVNKRLKRETKFGL